MKLRQIIIVGVAIAILIIGKVSMDALSVPAEKGSKKVTPKVSTVFTTPVQNDSIAIYAESTGALKAKVRTELFSEVQGVMLPNNQKFKAGNIFSQGEVLLAIRADDQKAALTAQRSSFISALTAVMPDIKTDFSDAYDTWYAFLSGLDATETLNDLPEVNPSKLKGFLTGKNIYSSYYSLKNAEINLAKFTIRAPFDGVLVTSNVDPGTVIRPGQALGVFIQPGVFELESSIDAKAAQRMQVGQTVELFAQDQPNIKWNGEVTRVVQAIDPQTQMSSFFVEVRSEALRDGMFLQARVKATSIPNAIEIGRSALLNGNQVYVVKDQKLELETVQVEYINQATVVISGLENGMQVVNKVPPSAFEGMSVTIYQEK